MSNKINQTYSSTLAIIYALVWSDELVWDGTAFVGYDLASRISGAIYLVEDGIGSRRYTGEFPAGIAANSPNEAYEINVFEQLGAQPANDDTLVGVGQNYWNGTALTEPSSAPAWGASVVGNGRTRDYFLQGGMNKVDFAASGESFTVYSTDDITILYEGVSSRLATTVGGLRSITPN